MSTILFSSDSITLRQQEKIFAHCRLSLRAFGENMYLIPEVFLFLIFIKVLNEDYYADIRSKTFSILELQEKFYTIIKNKLNEDTERLLMWLEAYLVLYYSNYINPYLKRDKIYKYDSDLRTNTLLIDSVINKSSKEQFLNIFENIERSRNGGTLDLSHFIKRIDLTEALIN
ncbi:hypothetical protein D3C86_874430 [compost metagenome]